MLSRIIKNQLWKNVLRFMECKTTLFSVCLMCGTMLNINWVIRFYYSLLYLRLVIIHCRNFEAREVPRKSSFDMIYSSAMNSQ